MTTAEKLRTMEALWETLQATPGDVPAPAWHADVLRARSVRTRRGRSGFGDWAEAKRRIRARVE
ncbi:MAG: addiction module protein [Acidobacteriota bacterium]